MKQILILNGPNLNLLGTREPEIYGYKTLATVEDMCAEKATSLGWSIDFRQSNHEGNLVDWVQEANTHFDGLIINAAAYTHTSIALHDALKSLTIPIIEVHLSNPKEREDFRHHSYVEPFAATIITGQGADGYVTALDSLTSHL